MKEEYKIKEVYNEDGEDIEHIIKEIFKNYVISKLEKN